MTLLQSTGEPLNYGPRGRFVIHRGLAVAAAFLLAATVFAVFGPQVWGRYLYASRVRDLQSLCLRYSPPAGQVVYSTDRRDRAAILSDVHYRPFNDWAVFTTPAPWHDFRGAYACPDGTAFLHSRAAASGPVRLVAVDIIPTAADVVWLRWGVSDRAPLLDTSAIERCRKTVGATTVRLDANGRTLKLFAGQIDPSDSSAFTIAGSFGSDIFQIDGRLMGDGRVVLRQHPQAAGVAAVAGVSCDATGPSGPGFDPSVTSLSACNFGKH